MHKISCFALTFLVMFVTLASSRLANERPCEPGYIKCHTCLGQDMESCTRDYTCCNGACYKIVDHGHNVILKGCEPMTSGSGEFQAVRHGYAKEAVTLPWANDEPIGGIGYFCEASDFCNGAAVNVALRQVLILSLFVAIIQLLF